MIQDKLAKLTDRIPIPPVPYDGSLFMRPFAIGATTYLITLNFLYIVTRGSFPYPDRWAVFYLMIMGTYAGGPEVKRMAMSSDAADPDSWAERLRKGGPIVTAWVLLLAFAATWRLVDSATPLPPELETIATGVVGLFFGTYALRQYRKRSLRERPLLAALPETAGQDEEDRQRILTFLRHRGPATPKAMSDALGIPRRTLTRLLADLMRDQQISRESRPSKDPFARFCIRQGPAKT